MLTERLEGTLMLTRQGGTTYTVSMPYATQQPEENEQAARAVFDRGR